MASIQENIIANYAGKAWAAGINLACIPLYIKYLGIEAYGLVGFFAALQPLLHILDMGLGPTVNRELARYSALPGQEGKMRDLVRTLEVVYWGMAVILGVFVLILTPTVSASWINAETLSPEQVRLSVLLMGISMVLLWPVGFYSGGLMGLQRQVLLNVLNSVLWTLRGVGAVLVIIVSSNKVVAFFAWQLVMSLLNVGAIFFLLWRSLPPSSGPPRFDKVILKSVWRLALGMTAVSITSLVFNQVDKILLIRWIPLTQFGYYSLAWQVLGCLFLFYYPVYSAFFPPITQALSRGDRKGMTELYHKGWQFMSVSVLPVAVIISLFSKEIIRMWTQNPETAEQCYRVLSLLMVGVACNGMFSMAYALRQATGSMRQVLFIFIPFLLVYVLLLFWVVPLFGLTGVAVVFSVVSFLKIGTTIYFTHRDIVPGEHIRWCMDDIGRPLAASLAVGLTGKWIIGDEMHGWEGILKLGLVSSLTLAAAAYQTTATRSVYKKFGGRLTGK